MILRIWRGWTRPEDADAYEDLLTGEIIPSVADGFGDDFHGYEVGRREDGDEVGFVVLTRFASVDAVEAFSPGGDPEEAHVPAEARELLTRWDDRVSLYEVRASGSGP